MKPVAPDSNWWYGVAIPPILELIGWAGLGVARPFGYIREGGSAFAILAPGLTLMAGLFLIPVFALCLFFDARAVERSAVAWNPSPILWGVGGLMVPLVGLVGFDQSLSVPIAALYLYRRVSTGVPHRASSTETDVVEAGEDGRDSRAITDVNGAHEPPGRISNWWLGVAVPIVAYAVFVGSAQLLEVVRPDQIQAGSSLAMVSLFTTFLTVIALLAQFVLAPVFSFSLVFDGRRIRASDTVDWRPHRVVWPLVALTHLLAMIVTPVMLASVAGGVAYLWRRHVNVGRP